MNVKKRPRLELATAVAATATDVALMSSSYGNGSIGSIGNIGNTAATNGLFLTTSSLGGLGTVGGVDINNGAQIYLTICGEDDNSNESQEFYAIESIKQEPGDLDALHHALLPTNLQLPTGCEIYLVKDTMATTTAAAAATPTATTAIIGCPKTINNDQLLQKHTQSIASIKLEPDSIHPSTPSTTNVLFVSGSNHTPPNTHHNILVAATNSKDSPSSRSSIAPIAATSAPPHPAHSIGYNVKLDAYKKRDDKRRATHNEVERRRRDKIKIVWIFKLKEMLPTEGNRYKSPINNAEHVLDTGRTTTTTTTTTIKSNQNNGRTPPNDSKSQILIKACDYIKSMQNEIDK